MRLIDADALCRSLTDWQYGDFARVGHETEYNLIDKVLAGVSVAPTIDAVPVVHGEWIVDDMDAVCSHCNAIFCGEWGTLDLIEDCDMHYCPNCGAKMDGGTNHDKT